jgi:hypothetical protein
MFLAHSVRSQWLGSALLLVQVIRISKCSTAVDLESCQKVKNRSEKQLLQYGVSRKMNYSVSLEAMNMGSDIVAFLLVYVEATDSVRVNEN